MSKDLSPRGLCSTTMGTRGTLVSLPIALLSIRSGLSLRPKLSCNPQVAHGVRPLNKPSPHIPRRSQAKEQPMKVTRERTVDADPADVWETLTDDILLSAWLGAEVELEPVEGGEGRFEFSDGEVRDARVTDVEPEERIAWDWHEGDSSVGRVELRVEAVSPGRSRVVVVESRPTDLASGGPEWRPAMSALASMHASVCA